MNIEFSGAGIAFLNHFKATHDIRYYLKGIYLQPLPPEAGGGVLGAATNGQIMGLWYDKDGKTDRAIICRVNGALASACGKPRHKGVPEAPKMILKDGRLMCAAGPYEIYVQPNEYHHRMPEDHFGFEIVWEKYPDTAKVTPDPRLADIGPLCGMRAVNLGIVARAFRAQEKPEHTGITMRQIKADGGIIVQAPRMPEATAVVMGMRETDPNGSPWIGAWLDADAALKSAASSAA